MEFLIVCSKGLEEALIWEAKGFDLKEKEKSDYVVILKGKFEDFVKFSYFSQIAKNCLIYNDKYTKIQDIENLKLKDNITDLINDKETFKVKMEIPMKEEKDLSQGLSVKCGELILDIAKKKEKDISVKMHNPDKMIYGIYIENNLYIGSLVNKNFLDTRDYRLFLTNSSLKSNIAFWSWCNIANILKKDYNKFKSYLKDKKIIDLNCSTGEIGIEISLYLNDISHNKYRSREIFYNWFRKYLQEYKENLIKNNITLSDQSLRELNFAKKNSKVIEVNDIINFTRNEIEYLDVKFDEEEIDFVNSKIFQPGAHEEMSKYEEKYRELFYQLDYITKKNGIISFVFTKKDVLEVLIEKSKEFNFSFLKEFESFLGEQKYYQLIFKKK